ncbi:MAG: ferritin family protein [Nanoarchaeota archaeon]
MESDLILIKKAMDLEALRYKTYKKISKKVFNREVKEILIKLSEVEKKHYNILHEQISHIKRFKKINLSILKKNKVELSKKEVNFNTISRIKSDIDLMKVAEEIEKNDVKFYENLSKKTKNKELKKVFIFLKKEEAMHIKIIKLKLQKLQKLNLKMSVAKDARAMFYHYINK